MAMATATAASLGGQMRAEPYPTYASRPWARKYPDKYGANVPSGIKTAFNIIRAELTGQTWGFTVDENAPKHVKGVTNTLNWIGSTWGRAVDGAWQATDAAFGFFAWATGTNSADQQLIQAAMDFCGTATTFISAPVKAGMAVVLANLYSGMLIKFGYATPQSATAKPQRLQNGQYGYKPGEDSSSYLNLPTSEPQPSGLPSEVDAQGVVGDAQYSPDYLANVGQNSNSL